MKRPIIFIHGLWLSSRSWENFERYFGERGHQTTSPEWPHKDGDVEQLRANADGLKGLGITEIVDHYDTIVRALPEPPILIGHSFGGLFTMMLLDRGLGAAGVALDPAPPKGILNLPLRQLRASAPALGKPWKRNGVVDLTLKQFTYGFVNTFPPDDAKAAYERYAVPDTARPLFEAAMANLNPHAANTIAFDNATRAPLLITAGEEDNTVPASVSRSIHKKFGGSSTRTDLLELPGKPHLLSAGPGWEDVAQRIADWLDTAGVAETAS